MRISKNLSQEDLGNTFDVSKGTISSWESGRTQPPIETITKLAQYFGVTTDYLLGFNQDDIDKIEQLKVALKEAGIDEIEKAMKIIGILSEEKDTNK